MGSDKGFTMKSKNITLKAFGLLAASSFGLSANGLDLNNYLEVDTGNTSAPTLLTDKYYSNMLGETYQIINGELDILYDLDDSVLTHINNSIAMGYILDTNYSGGNYFRCEIEKCNVISERSFINATDYFLYDNASYRSNLNYNSGFDNSLVIGRNSSSSENFSVSVLDSDEQTLDSFIVKGNTSPYINTYQYLVSTTGITQEENFKLLSSSHGEYSVSFKQWNSDSQVLEDLSFQLNNGVDINTAYPNGLAPIAISNPVLDINGLITYKVVLAQVIDKNNDLSSISNLLWGEVTVSDGVAKFSSEIKSSSYSLGISYGALVSGAPIFNNNNSFTFNDQRIDFDAEQEFALSKNELIKDGKTMYGNIYKKSASGNIIAREISGNYFLYIGSSLNLTSSNMNIDPYLDPSFSITLASKAITDYYGVEANCTLQTTNASIDSQDYLALSETALQIPLEWDSLTGEWKGVQSLTGLESITSSHGFSQFDLIADVTTGTWSMSCSGIASDIKGNQIPLASTDITINLDDQIHGGSGLVSGQVTMPNTSDYSGVVITITLNGRQINVTTEEDGSFSFERLVEGEYQVHLYNDQFVAACNTVVIDSSNDNTPLTIQMYAGDINNDGAVDIGDFSLLSGLMGLTSSDEGYNSLADLNHDGIINVQDLSILGSHFGTDHCEASPE